MTNIDSKLKSRDITLLAKVPLVKAMVFPGVMYDVRNLKHTKTDYFNNIKQQQKNELLDNLEI